MIRCKNCGWECRISDLEENNCYLNCPNCDWILGRLDERAMKKF